MEVKNEKLSMSLYIKLVLCTVVIAGWALWLNNTPQKERIIKNTKEDKSIEANEAKEAKKKIIYTISKEDILAKTKVVLPKLANLSPPMETHSEKVQNIEKKQDISFTDYASSTKKALQPDLQENKTIQTTDSNLREKATVDKSQLKPVLKTIKQNKEKEIFETSIEESWLPRYLLEANEKTGIGTNMNLDEIANQLELSGLILNPDGQSAAIVKNKTTNKIKILKKGDEYLGLKVLDLKTNEVIFRNKESDKTYIKKIVTSN